MAFTIDPILFLSFFVSFITTFFMLPYWIKRAKKAELVGIDLHKINKPKLAEIGGIVVVFGFLVGVLFYIGIRTFYFNNSDYILKILSILTTILIMTIIGLIDDILGWKIGLKQWQKPVLALIAALPIMVVNAGQSKLIFPLFGAVDINVFYAILIVPVAISGASNGFNMLAGYNGLEAGLGIIILTTLAYISWIANASWMSIIALCMVFSLIAFLIYNKYPAEIFPGNTLTYSVGALIACIAIFASIERAALILFIPYFFELILKLRGSFKKESFAKLEKDGSLIMPYDKIYGLEHLAIYMLGKFRDKVSEKAVVYSIFAFEFIFVIIVLMIT